MESTESELVAALHHGDPAAVAALIAAGADIRYTRDHGYDALIDAVHGRDITRDALLLDLLRLLVANGVSLDGVTSFKESGLRVLSHVGRFDAVRLLLVAGADRGLLQWTPLLEAVALGSPGDVERLLAPGAAREEADWWSRPPWLLALLAGDRAKAELLRAAGADADARGRCGTPPLFYAIEGHHPEVLRWLLASGQDVEQTDDFGGTALTCAVDNDELECLEILLAAGAAVDREARGGNALHRAETARIARRLLEAGADPSHLTHAGQRALCALGDVRPDLPGASEADFSRAPTRRFGSANPHRMHEPFWEAMVRAGLSGFEAGRLFDPGEPHSRSPVWCAQRFGQSITFLPDGRIVQIAGEHEDAYDPDFCIYNDVFVHNGRGVFEILGYPESVFPPTDFHTATLVDGAIFIVGSLGYMGTRLYGHTPIYRLDVGTLRMERCDASGDAPGWIYGHRAVRVAPGSIHIRGGKIVTRTGAEEVHAANTATFVLDIAGRIWRREPRDSHLHLPARPADE